jgi:hypothetical protein
MRRSFLALTAVAVLGLATGVALGLLTSLLAASGPGGEGWSLRGNGALIVPFGLAPALVAAGWAGVVAHLRSLPNWPVYGFLAGLVGVGLSAASLLSVVAGGSGGTAVAAVATLLVPLWTLAAPLVVSMLPSRGGARERGGAGAHVLAAIALPVAMVAGFVLAQLVVPPGG